MMIDRILNRKTLLCWSTVSAVLYASLGILMYMMDLHVPTIIVYVLLGITLLIGILFFARDQKYIRHEWKQTLLICLFLCWEVLFFDIIADIHIWQDFGLGVWPVQSHIKFLDTKFLFIGSIILMRTSLISDNIILKKESWEWMLRKGINAAVILQNSWSE